MPHRVSVAPASSPVIKAPTTSAAQVEAAGTLFSVSLVGALHFKGRRRDKTRLIPGVDNAR